MPKLEEKEERSSPFKKKTVKDHDDDRDSSATTGSGWDTVANRKKANEEAKESAASDIYDFRLKDSEEAQIQFLEDEPYAFDAHSVKKTYKKGKDVRTQYLTEPCQLATQKTCVLCDEGVKTSWKACLKVLDFRGTWDKEKNKFKFDGPVEKKWLFSNTVALAIRKQYEKRGSLKNFVFEVSRTGSSAQDTSYQIGLALDEDGNKIKPIKWKEKYPNSETLCAPSSNARLTAKAYSAAND